MSTNMEFFLRLSRNENDPSEILNLIGSSEDLYLECKTLAEDDIIENRITNKQSVPFFNYGKSLSAFANAEGGIVVWGLFAKEQDKSSPDLIFETRPLKKVTKVKTDFDSITGKVVSRRVVGVQNKVVYQDKDQDLGFIVTYIPKSDEVPHRVEGEKTGSRRYYRRHGNGSYEMEHYELEELFGGRSTPYLKFVLSAKSNLSRNGLSECRIKFGLKNTGKSIAKYPFIELKLPSRLPFSDFGIDGNSNKGIPYTPGNRSRYQANVNQIIHIDDILWIDSVHFMFDQTTEIKDPLCQLKIRVACDGFRMRNSELTLNLNDLVKTTDIFEFDLT
ncbi:MAG: RNA-binding domain-containing protein [Syntrophomonas sp.]